MQEVKNYKDFAKEIYNQTQTFKQKNMTFRSKEHESTLISQSNEFQSEISKLRAEIADNVNTTEQVQQ
jgi:gas vesicle protein